MSSAKDIRDLLLGHNQEMRTMLGSCERGYTWNGLSAARLMQALFSEQQIELIAHESGRGPMTFDQRSIGKNPDASYIIRKLPNCVDLTRA